MNPLARRGAALLTAALLCLATAAAAHAAEPRGSYSGKVTGTGAGQKLKFKVAGGKVGSTRARITMACNGPYATVTYRLRGSARVSRNRTFRLVRRATVKTKGGSVLKVRLTVAGRFNRAGTRASGTVRGRGSLTEPGMTLVGGLPEPGETSACSTPPGKQKFRVKR